MYEVHNMTDAKKIGCLFNDLNKCKTNKEVRTYLRSFSSSLFRVYNLCDPELINDVVYFFRDNDILRFIDYQKKRGVKNETL